MLEASSLARSFLLPYARPLPCPSVPSESIYEQTPLRQCSVVTITCWRVYAHATFLVHTSKARRYTVVRARTRTRWASGLTRTCCTTRRLREYRAVVLNVLYTTVTTRIEQRFTCARTHMRAGYIDASTHICTRALVGAAG